MKRYIALLRGINISGKKKIVLVFQPEGLPKDKLVVQDCQLQYKRKDYHSNRKYSKKIALMEI